MSEVLTLQEKQEDEEAEESEDDMTCGDLGNGLGRRPGGVYETESNSEVPNEELKQHLRDALEEIEILKVELETSQRQLEGKGEALRILQNMAVFNKATSHTKAMLQKAEEKKRTLEKEINALQWEIEYDQDRFKNIEETWTEKYDRIYCENAALKETLKLRTDEVKILKSENTILSQQHLEFLAMLDVKQQKVVQENMSFNKTGFTDITGLELAVLGACTCNPSGEPCSCAKMSAVTRKQLLQLKQETEHLKKSKDEAYIMADAFRIAFEQQLMQRKDQALRFTQVNKLRKKETKFINWKRLKEDGHITSQGNKKSLGQKLAGMLISDADCRTIEELHNPHEALRVLVDLLNDKEEALAHQRKVSYMLARAKELKEETSKQSKENNLSGESITQKNCQYSTTESQESSHCANSCCQNPGSQNSTCSTYNTKVLKNSLRSLRKSYSWPPGTMHCKENDAHEIGRTTDVDSTS